MQLPSGWDESLAQTLAEFPDMRAVARTAMNEYDISRFDREIQSLLDQLFTALPNAPQLAEEVDLFGNAHWYNYGSFNADVAALTPLQYQRFVRDRFRDHCSGELATALAAVDESVWRLLTAMHFIYMLFSLYDKERCRKDFGLELNFKRRLRVSANPLVRCISRCL